MLILCKQWEETSFCEVTWLSTEVCACAYFCVDRVPIISLKCPSQSSLFHLVILSKYLTNSPKCTLAEQLKSDVSHEAFPSHSALCPINPAVTNHCMPYLSSNVILQCCLILHQSHLLNKIKPSWFNKGKIVFLCSPQCCVQSKHCSIEHRVSDRPGPAIF